MLRHYRKIIFAALVLTGLLFSVSALAYTKPGNPSGFVNDFAGVLSAGDKNALEQKLDSFEKETSNEISIAIIPDLGGDTVENYAVNLFKDWGVGKTGRDNGILILVAIKDRQMRIETGYGLEGALTDIESQDIINNVMKPAFQQGQYYSGLNQATDLIIAKTKGEYAPIPKPQNSSSSPFSMIIIYFIIFGLSILFRIFSRSTSWWAGGVIGGVAGVIIGLIKGFLFTGIIWIAILIPAGLLFDFIASKRGPGSPGGRGGFFPIFFGGGRGGSGGGFGGFGGGRSGGGGSSGGW